MFKKLSSMTVLSATLLFGGVFSTSVDAATKSDQSKQQQYKVYHSTNISGDADQTWKDFSRYFNKFTFNNWYQKKWEIKQPVKENNPQAENVQQEIAKVEQPKQEIPKAEQPKEEQQAPKQEQQTQTQLEGLSQFEQEVVELTNNERIKNGLAPLQADLELSRVAREKSRDMSVRNYFDHNSPTYGSPFDMMGAYGITYRTAGENIAKGQRTPQEVVTAWMNSPGHRANILNGNFTHIGSGFAEQGNHWTQMFIGK